MLQQSPNQYARRWPSFFLAVLIEHLSSTPRYDISLRRNRASNVVRPLQRMRLERDAVDNRTALITPFNARFTDLGTLVSRLTFIQQWSYDRRCRTSHSCRFQTHAPQQ